MSDTEITEARKQAMIDQYCAALDITIQQMLGGPIGAASRTDRLTFALVALERTGKKLASLVGEGWEPPADPEPVPVPVVVSTVPVRRVPWYRRVLTRG